MMWLYFFLLFSWQDCVVMGTSKTSAVSQDSGLKIVKVGDSVTLHCSCADDQMTFFTWYQQKLGGKPELISKWLKGIQEPVVEPVFQQRFHIFQTRDKKETNNLKITDLQANDTASYFCGVEVFTTIEFGDGVFVHVQSNTSNEKSVVQEQEEKRELWVGQQLDLSCIVERGSCSGEQRFFWLKHGTSQPAIYYPENDCESSKENCEVKLKIKSVGPTDAGTYHCVLSACGEFLFGNGTFVQIKGSHTSVGVYVLSGALAFTVTLTVILMSQDHKQGTGSASVKSGTQPKRSGRSRVQRDDTWSECVYSEVHQ